MDRESNFFCGYCIFFSFLELTINSNFNNAIENEKFWFYPNVIKNFVYMNK